jgi:hypothetical protein
VSVADERGIRHSIEVTAETLYEAAATAFSMFKQSDWVNVVGPNSELLVAVKNPETTHRVTLAQVRRWCDGVAVSPEEVLKRRRIKSLIGDYCCSLRMLHSKT